MDNLEVIDSFWIHCLDGHQIGFVAVKIKEGWKVYAGALDFATTEKADEQRIVQSGGKVPSEKALSLFPRLPADQFVF